MLVRRRAGLRPSTHPQLPTSILSCSQRTAMSAARIATLPGRPRLRSTGRVGRTSGRTQATGRVWRHFVIVKPRATNCPAADAGPSPRPRRLRRPVCSLGVLVLPCSNGCRGRRAPVNWSTEAVRDAAPSLSVSAARVFVTVSTRSAAPHARMLWRWERASILTHADGKTGVCPTPASCVAAKRETVSPRAPVRR